ncbi:MAG: ATP-grasp domain-containing protein [Erysipelotrichaceae bacterium]
MHKGWLVYTKEDYTLNKWFADHFVRVANQMGVKLQLQLVEHPSDFELKDVTFVVNRSRFVDIAQKCEAMGIVVFNHAQATRLGNDKVLMSQTFAKAGLPVIPWLENEPWPSYPFILKDPKGHGGKQVYWIDNAMDYARHAQQRHMVQPVIAPTIGDLRVVVCGERILASFLRSNPTDFRHNAKQGATVQWWPCSPAILEVVNAVQQQVHFDLGGIDFLLMEDGTFYINEIEDVVGVRSVYALSEVDVVVEYVRHIMERLGGHHEL